ncbi:uroporphyrinogen-III synthase [Methanobrevibacter sp. TMH8]|uniref:uroporphyrinogen-III synthase n=1 Tax=Methanobrevibacter sp. TMH8 TaxID=2848611 RepID=UPI001CCDECEB|nr:uroporphyrinogen-III synthase [Methanobrevibacter sp. TMH8]MBZ9570687.1 uroporphyrinogen-III synthase [Methanobrevibacter sp. TMH8]
MEKNENKIIVAITRPFNRIDEAVSIVESHGATPFIAPTLELKLSNTESLKALVELVNDLDWLVFTSPTSIESIFNFYPDFREKVNENCQIATIGHKTEEVAAQYGLTTDLIPEDYTAEGLLKAFKNINIKNSLIGIPRTLAARDTLPEGLEKMGADVILAESYESIIPLDTVRIEVLIGKILSSEIDAITFTSPLTAENLFKIATEEQIPELVNKLSKNVLTVSIGPITYKTLKNLGVESIYPKKYTVKDMMELMFENL